ncbi:MAG: NTP transferase domain-containing protein, partial [Planctomycetes bacterium]|nr:NTP transferase domain-containing protein [Planctomycetota bacterium]
MPDGSDLMVIVLAAGRGQRLGRDKALLPWGPRTLIQHVTEQFPRALVGKVVVVANRANHTAIRGLLPGRVDVVVNSEPEADMLSSVRCGIAARGGSDVAVCVHPVDVFAVLPELVRQLHAGWHVASDSIHVPVVGGKRAHPVLIPPLFVGAIAEIPGGWGLNRLLRD